MRVALDEEAAQRFLAHGRIAVGLIEGDEGRPRRVLAEQAQRAHGRPAQLRVRLRLRELGDAVSSAADEEGLDDVLPRLRRGIAAISSQSSAVAPMGPSWRMAARRISGDFSPRAAASTPALLPEVM